MLLFAVCMALQRDRVQGNRLHARPGWQLWPQGAVDMLLSVPSALFQFSVLAISLMHSRRLPNIGRFMQLPLAAEHRNMHQSSAGECCIVQAVLSIIDNWQIPDNRGVVRCSLTGTQSMLMPAADVTGLHNSCIDRCIISCPELNLSAAAGGEYYTSVSSGLPNTESIRSFHVIVVCFYSFCSTFGGRDWTRWRMRICSGPARA
jgi:hypothetical protein